MKDRRYPIPVVALERIAGQILRHYERHPKYFLDDITEVTIKVGEIIEVTIRNKFVDVFEWVRTTDFVDESGNTFRMAWKNTESYELEEEEEEEEVSSDLAS